MFGIVHPTCGTDAYDAEHDVLMSLLGRTVRDKRLLGLIGRYLRAGVLVGEHIEPSEVGTPQGGPLSPLLANILLHQLDCELEKRGHRFARYADDMIILVKSQRQRSLVVRPHAQYTHRTFFFEHFVDETVLNVDSARIGSVKISYEPLEGRRILKWIVGQDFEKFLRLFLQPSRRELFCIFQRVLGIDEGPLHQTTAFALLLRGCAIPFLMDSRMPGTDRR